ncbi:LuxR C-terminal-related transcriptional regulator [Nonomuraea sp. NPDC049684]|uniref:helix-turn-helix transcriptional regulator n=1 Tax=Nonomuraea sp. NPDC049684 TaxID=3364356 RepID=UPI0037A8E5B0
MHHVPDLVEAALRSGRIARAAEQFARLESWAATLGRRWADALVLRCRALLDTAGDPGAHFRAAPAARTRTELGATGWSAPRRTGAARFARLTPQERQIVQLAATGLSNRDIAAHLFLSPRTVGQHLYKAFPKLGVTARGQLAGLTLDE